MQPSPAPAGTPVVRAVLLGASNLRMGLPLVIRLLHRAAGGPVEALAACGHGRSYVQWSQVLFGARSLPGLVGCGLWKALAGRPPLRTLALAMDVGNDLLYGPAPERIAAAFGTCLERLAAAGADLIAMTVPLVSLEKVSRFRYHAARAVLFPSWGDPWAVVLERARDLDRRCRELATAHGARLIEPQADWYGLDPIHFHGAQKVEAWNHIFAPWMEHSPAQAPGSPLRFRVPLLGAEEMRVCGTPRTTVQPACRLSDGSTLALY